MRGLTHFEDTVLSLLTSRVVAAFSYRLYACLPFPNAIVYKTALLKLLSKPPGALTLKFSLFLVFIINSSAFHAVNVTFFLKAF